MRLNKQDGTYQCYSAFKIKQGVVVQEKRTTYKVLSCAEIGFLYDIKDSGYLLSLKKVVLEKVKKQ